MSFRDNAFPLMEGKVNLMSGTYNDGIFVCVDSGSLSVEFNSNTETIVCNAGDAYRVYDAIGITIVSGTFHVNDRG